MVVPLRAGQKVLGAMAVWRNGGRPFEPRELEFLVGLSRQATLALQNVRLFNETAGGARAPDARPAESLQASATRAQPVADGRAGVRCDRRSATRRLGGAIGGLACSATTASTWSHSPAATREADAGARGSYPAPPDRAPSSGCGDRSPARRCCVDSTTRDRPVAGHATARGRRARGYRAMVLSRRCDATACSSARSGDPARGGQPRRHAVELLADLRRPGRDRDRERAPVQRDQGGARAPDRDGRDPAVIIAARRPTCSRCSMRSPSARACCAARASARRLASTASCCTWSATTASRPRRKRRCAPPSRCR